MLGVGTPCLSIERYLEFLRYLRVIVGDVGEELGLEEGVSVDVIGAEHGAEGSMVAS